MKKILLGLFVVLIVSGCSHSTTNLADTPSPSPVPESEESQPEDLSNPQQALVIGNSEYKYSPLTNPMNDAKNMADTLTNMGFSVTVKTNLDNQAMNLALSEFSQHLSQIQAQVGLFYFSGHGTQHNGQTFLLPINNDNIQTEVDLTPNAIQAKTILTNMEQANKHLNLIILDAFYQNPYRGSGETTFSRDNEVQMSLPRGSLIALSAAPEQFALKNGDNGLYTTHLLKVLADAKHKRIEDVFMEANESVIEASQGKQEPWYQASFREPFCFGGCL
jgi:uncharacterized caspase-like protein